MKTLKKLAQETFKLRGMGAIVIVGAASAFIASAGLVYNLVDNQTQPVLWAVLAFTASIYLFFVGLIVGDMLNIHESEKRLNNTPQDYYI
jgi:FtsH-binding integral membrane protein